MKNISEFISESRNNEWICEEAPFCWKPDAAYISLTDDENVYGFLSEDDIKNWEQEFNEDPKVIKTILNLKPGGCFCLDGVHNYIRIKK